MNLSPGEREVSPKSPGLSEEGQKEREEPLGQGHPARCLPGTDLGKAEGMGTDAGEFGGPVLR